MESVFASFFFQAEDGIRDHCVTGVQTCALPICLDLLAYRFRGDVPALIKAVCDAVDKPVVVAGSIDRSERIAAVLASGAAGFTVGTAAFEETFPAARPGLAAQLQAIQALVD